MGKTIFKYGAELADDFTIGLPEDAQILTVQIQHGKPFIWALVDLENRVCDRRFRLIGTGHPANGETLSYINTFQLNNGSLVFHLFDTFCN